MKSVQGREELEIAREEASASCLRGGRSGSSARTARRKGIELVRCVSVFDDDGRFQSAVRRVPAPTIDADTIILAIGQAPDLSFLKPEDGVETTPAGSLKIDPVTLATNMPGVFARRRRAHFRRRC